MPGAKYLAAYPNKKLNEVVFPGAHDAGVYTANATNVQTQTLDITQQANCGCRFFDLRIATHKTKNAAGQTVYKHEAFHLDPSMVGSSKIKSKNRPNANVTSHQSLSKMGKKLGGWGGGLDSMLQQARGFVTAEPTEFLIMKFSKCYNWAGIAETCAAVLGPKHYTGGGNLNTKTVSQLAGKVITLFDEASRKELAPVITRLSQGLGHGIMFFKALYDKSTGVSSGYDPNYWGLQYFGKFSSTDKVDKNTQKQRKTLVTGAATHMDAMGMMYWTTTGLMGNIKTRNDKMWTATNKQALRDTWEAGLEASITHRFGNEINSAMRLANNHGGALGGRMKSFMPNIVMIDFVDGAKCNTIEQLNGVSGQALQGLMIPAPRGPQPHPDPVG